MISPPTVSLVKSRNHVQGVQRSLELIKDDIMTSLSGISSLVVKINMVDARKELATTPFLAVKSFVDFLLPFYAGEIVVAEASSWGNTKEGFEAYGFSEFAEENSQVKLLDLREDEVVEKMIEYPDGELVLPISRTVLESPFIVSITRPKTHCTVVITLGIKNAVVGMIQKWRNRLKIHRGKFIHSIIMTLAGFAYPRLVVIDGTIGMEGMGPISGTRIESAWALASLDALAADSLAAYLMGFAIDDVRYLALLGAKEVGALHPRDAIDVVGESPDELVTPYKPHKTFKKQRAWRDSIEATGAH